MYIFIVKCQQRLEQFCEDRHQWFSHNMGIRRQTPTTRHFGSSSFIPSTCNVQGPEHSTMSYPNPKEAPNAFLGHLKSLDLDSAVAAFLHDQTRPSQQPNGRLDEVKAHEWCNQMDSLLVRLFFHLHLLDANYLQGKLNHAIPSHPAHKDLCVMLGRLCTDTIVDVEAQVVKQWEADEAEAKRLADEKQAKEAVRLATEQKIKEMREELAKLTGAKVQPAAVYRTDGWW